MPPPRTKSKIAPIKINKMIVGISKSKEQQISDHWKKMDNEIEVNIKFYLHELDLKDRNIRHFINEISSWSLIENKAKKLISFPRTHLMLRQNPSDLEVLPRRHS